MNRARLHRPADIDRRSFGMDDPRLLWYFDFRLHMFITVALAPPADIRVYALPALVLVIVAILLFLNTIVFRERVKRSLPENCLKWVSIRWSPLAPGWEIYWHPGFRVIYIDAQRRVHKAYCRPMDITWRSPMVWTKDEVTG